MIKKNIIILGGGISGLSLGWFLKQKNNENYNITILEKENRCGGWIQTVKQDGFLFEKGPRSCRTQGNGIATLQLIEELGLQDEVIIAHPSAKKRFLYTNQQLMELPSNKFSFFFSPFFFKIIKAIFNDLTKVSKTDLQDESIHTFLSRRFGLDFAETFFDPLVSGIYAGDVQKLSIKSCFPILNDLERDHGSIVKGVLRRKKNSQENLSAFVKKTCEQSLFSLNNGMEAITEALSKNLSNEIRLSQEIKEIKFNLESSEIFLTDGQILKADHLFSTLPSESLAQIVKSNENVLANLLMQIRTTSVYVANLGFKSYPNKFHGFGYLVPHKEKEKILGTVWDSSVFPKQSIKPEELRITVMLGGELHQNVMSKNPEELKQIIIDSTKKHMGLDREPDTFSLSRAHKAIPQYEVGHAELIQKIESECNKISSGFTILGNSYYGVSVNDCIAKAKEISQKFCNMLCL